MTSEQFLALKKTVERLRQDEARQQGALEQLLQGLKDEFGCGSAKEAEGLLQKLDAENKAAGVKADKLHRRFVKNHGQLL